MLESVHSTLRVQGRLGKTDDLPRSIERDELTADLDVSCHAAESALLEITEIGDSAQRGLSTSGNAAELRS